VELLTSRKQTPNDDWLGFVITAKAKSRIKQALKNVRRKIADEGREILERKFNKQKLDFTIQNIDEFTKFLKLTSSQELFYRAAKDVVGIAEIKDFVNFKLHPEKYVTKKLEKQHTVDEMVTQARGKSDMLVIGDDMQQLDYKLSPCCTPIPGDDVFGFITVGEGIKIHRVNCPNAAKLLANYAYRVVKAKWNSDKLLTFLSSVKITGTDAMGIVNNITKVISTQHNVNMRSITFDTEDGIFEGTIMVYVHSTEHLTQLINNLKKVPGVINVQRIDGENKQ
jgi:GTP pyrophosphokinase